MRLSKSVQETLRRVRVRNERGMFLNEVNQEKMAQAIQCYYRRLRLQEEPEGEFRFGIWLPSANEQKYCCNTILKRGVRNGNDLLHHCRSHTHISFKFGISSAQLLHEVKQIAEDQQLREAIEHELEVEIEEIK